MAGINIEAVKQNQDLLKILVGVFNDLTALKTAVDTQKTLIDELHDDGTSGGTVIGDLKVLANDIKAKLAGDYLDSATTLAIGTTKPNVSSVAFEFHVNDKEYSKAAVAAGTALSGDNIPQNKYGSWALDIGINGTVDIVAGAANATGWDSAAEAVADLPAVAADHVRMGYVTAMKSDAVFVPGTTDLDDASTTEVYTDGTTGPVIAAAVGTSAPGTPSASKPTAVGTLETVIE